MDNMVEYVINFLTTHWHKIKKASTNIF